MSQLSTQAINDLPDSAFALIQPGGTKDSSGKTVPRSLRHFPIHDEAHTRNALARLPQSNLSDSEKSQARTRILAAAKKFGIQVTGQSSLPEDLSGYPEKRFTKYRVETRRADSSPTRIVGYASVFGKLSRSLGGFVERVAPGAFNESRADGFPGVICRYNHDSNMVLGTTAGRTLDLRVDQTGLFYDVLPPQSRSDILELVERGDVQHSSFAFRVLPGGDEWGVTDQNYPMRTVLATQLVDVAPVLDPAYPDASAKARAISPAVESLAMWVQADPDEVRSMLAENRGIEFFKRTDIDGGKPRPKPARPKPTLSGAQAMLALLDNQEDPYAAEG